MTKPLLIIPNLLKPFEVQCDACGESLGAVLLQEGHPIAYESGRLDPQEQVLGIYEKELLVVILALSSGNITFQELLLFYELIIKV